MRLRERLARWLAPELATRADCCGRVVEDAREAVAVLGAGEFPGVNMAMRWLTDSRAEFWRDCRRPRPDDDNVYALRDGLRMLRKEVV